MLDRLEKSGLIARKPNPNDRRSTHVVILQEAAERIAPLFASLRHAQDKIVSEYAERELLLLADFFEKSITMWEEERQKLNEA
jgi:DNA-binding MarR family transcriptional regulator